jgi:hypothetical protein
MPLSSTTRSASPGKIDANHGDPQKFRQNGFVFSNPKMGSYLRMPNSGRATATGLPSEENPRQVTEFKRTTNRNGFVFANAPEPAGPTHPVLYNVMARMFKLEASQ